MKKVIRPIFVLAMLLALVGSASAGETTKPIKFKIRGDTIYPGDLSWLDDCKLEFTNLTAAGRVSGGLKGSFTYVENGEISVCPPSPGGSNDGVMTIVTDHGKGKGKGEGTLVIEFEGQTDLRFVWGVWKLESATGDYAGIKGAGTYSGHTYFEGDTSLPLFTVTFDGSFYTDPH